MAHKDSGPRAFHIDLGTGKFPRPGNMGAMPVKKELLSRYFKPDEKPILCTRAIPDIPRLGILWNIIHLSREGAGIAARECLVDAESVGAIAGWLAREFIKQAKQAESAEFDEARELIGHAILIAKVFGLEDVRQEAIVALCNLLKNAFEPIKAAQLAARELPREVMGELVKSWRDAPSRSAPILEELRKKGII
jgi:hypothetical protein